MVMFLVHPMRSTSTQATLPIVTAVASTTQARTTQAIRSTVSAAVIVPIPILSADLWPP